jgi:hypothetical protein
MMTGLLRPDVGQILIDGLDVWADGPRAAKAAIGVGWCRTRPGCSSGSAARKCWSTPDGCAACPPRLRDIAASLNITERSAFGIIADLAEAGYVVKEKEARRNRYHIQARLPLPELGTADRRGRRGGENRRAQGPS